MTERRNPNKGRRRGRHLRNRNNSNHSTSSSQWQTLQTKITIRNLPFDSAAQILTVVGKMIAQANAESGIIPIKLDLDSVEKTIHDEELVLGTSTKEEGGDTPELPQDKPRNNAANPENLDKQRFAIADIAKEATDLPLEGPYIRARVMYVVPAKMSRRRGKKNGCAYLILTPPPPPPPRKPMLVLNGLDSSSVNSSFNGDTVVSKSSGNGLEPMQIDDDLSINDKAKLMNLHSSTTLSLPDDTVEHKKNTPSTYSAGDKSRYLSLSKLQLLHAIESLTALAEQDAKTACLYGKCQVEVSGNGKIWREKEPRDYRREVAIETTNDYKLFFSKQAKVIEERLSRPKPLPGGGNNGENMGGETDPKLSAIVVHLRNKHNEEANRKKSKQKAVRESVKGKLQQPGATNGSINTKKEVSKTRNKVNIKGAGTGGTSRANKSRAVKTNKDCDTAGTPSKTAPSSKSIRKGST